MTMFHWQHSTDKFREGNFYLMKSYTLKELSSGGQLYTSSEWLLVEGATMMGFTPKESYF